jgi:hypothetical protein
VDILHWVSTHFNTILAAVLWIATLIIAHGWIKNAYYQTVLKNAVAFVEQYRKVAKAMGNDDPPADVLKQMAVNYVQQRFPGVNLVKLYDDIEAAVHFLGTLKNPIVKMVAGKLDQFVEGLPDPLPLPPDSTSGARLTERGG